MLAKVIVLKLVMLALAIVLRLVRLVGPAAAATVTTNVIVPAKSIPTACDPSPLKLSVSWKSLS